MVEGGALQAHEQAGLRALFVGRRAELDVFRRALREPGPRLLLVHGPGGIGKTSLLGALEVAAGELGVACVRLDARDLEPTREALVAALEATRALAREGAPAGRAAVLIDTCELLEAIESTVVHELLARVRGETVVVLAGRTAPGAAWRGLSLWGSRIFAVPLRNLAADEAAEYLARRGVEGEVAAAIARLSHGHPLALAIAAETWRQAPGPVFAPEQRLDVVTALYDFFARGIAEPGRRAALEVAAVLPTITEAGLEAVLEGPADGLFAWLRALSFVGAGPRGLLIHELAREVILGELRWRSPERLAGLSVRAQRYYAALAETAGPPGSRAFLRAFADFMFALAHNPRARVLLVPPDVPLFVDDYRPADRGTIVAAIARHEGPEQAEIAGRWLAAQPGTCKVAREPSGAVAGLMHYIRLDLAAPEELAADPQALAAWRHAAAIGVEAGRPVAYSRFFMSCERHQEPHPPMVVVAPTVGDLVFMPGFALLFVRMHAWEHWAESARVCGAELVPALEHVAGGKRFVVTVQDNRGMSGMQWLAGFSARTAVDDWRGAAPRPSDDSAVAALSREEFRARVREALRSLGEPLALADNPLVHCQAVRARVASRADVAARAAGLQAVLLEQIEALGGGERGASWRRVVHAAYVAPAGRHEDVARRLGLSYSTFRRHLGAATEHIASRLWQFEVE